MEQFMVLGQHKDHKYGVTTRAHAVTRSMSSWIRDSSNLKNRVVFPGHVIQLRCDIALNRSKELLSKLPSSEQSTSGTGGKLRSGRWLPMGIVPLNNSEKRCLGIITAQQALSRSSTMPAILTNSSRAISHYHDGRVKRRVSSAIPSSRTSMSVDDLLTISSTNVKYLNMSRYKKSLQHGLHNVKHEVVLQEKKQEFEHKGLRDKDCEHKYEKEDECIATVTASDNIKVKIIVNQQRSVQSEEQHNELTSLTHDHGKDINLTTNEQKVVMKRFCNGRLSPLTGEHCKLPIGTLNGNSVCLTCKKDGSKQP